MIFFDRFKSLITQEKQNKTLHQLHTKVEQAFPAKSEDELAKIACIAGLLARVAFVDFHVHPDELNKMAKVIGRWSNFNDSEAQLLAQLARDEQSSLGGLENHLYCYPLRELLSKEERVQLLGALFALAASDESVSSEETEEIRLIAKGLLLEPPDFITAKLSVKEFLAVLK